LGTPGGTVDLKTGEILPAEPMRNITKLSASTPVYRANAPIWRDFLKTATHDDDMLQAYLQRLAGYCLTGLVSEQNLAFLWGPGGNGKSVFVNTVVGIMGEYARVAPMETFTASLGDRHPTELASLQGARLVTASETQEGRGWDEAKVKAITGGDKITARYMHRDFFTYDPTFKLVFLGNHKPAIGNLDDAMRRRFHMVPFTVKPPVVNRQLFDQLKQEWPAILGWMIEGCLAWQKEGLNPPAAVLEATAAYFEEEDPLGRWLAERCQAGEDTAIGELFSDFEMWCKESGEKRPTTKRFTQLLYSRGYQKSARDSKTGRYHIVGLKLKPMDLTEATAILSKM
jgi:putative DNA primase/helicase